PDDHVRVFRVDLHQARFAAPSLAGDQRAPGSAEEIGNDIAGFAAVEQSPFDKLDRFHRRVQPICGGLPLLPQRALRFVSVPGVVLAGGVGVENRLVLIFVTAESPGERVLRPDNLAANLEAAASQGMGGYRWCW